MNRTEIYAVAIAYAAAYAAHAAADQTCDRIAAAEAGRKAHAALTALLAT